jgi:hypothetical protein
MDMAFDDAQCGICMLVYDFIEFRRLQAMQSMRRSPTRRGGGIGRREGLKILWIRKIRAGSSPALGTRQPA